MKNSSKIYFITLLVLITAALSYFLYNSGVSIGAQSAAKNLVKSETIKLTKENIELSKNNKKISEKTEDLKKQAEELSEKDSELAEYTKLINDYQTKITSINKDLSELNSGSNLNSKYADQISKISNETVSQTKQYKDTTLNCPTDIKAGRYLIKGDGSFRIIKTTNNNVIESQNIKNLESKSYTTPIESDCRIIVEGVLTFTEVN